MVPNNNYPKIVRRQAGPGTCTGEGDLVTDSTGRTFQVISWHQAEMTRNSTAGVVYTLHPDGTVR